MFYLPFTLDCTWLNSCVAIDECAHFGATYALDFVNAGSGVLEFNRDLYYKLNRFQCK